MKCWTVERPFFSLLTQQRIKYNKKVNMILSSDSVSLTIFVLALTTVFAFPQQQQQQIDPAYLRDYYAQISQQNGRGAASASDATPIYEQEQSQPQAQSQYITPGQQQVKKEKK